ncbi:hypothetical protein [Brevibacillus sp. NRS-1366]|uniref:hypothetical protein n=1 Tax=Brevibacillus sp. NRS-1366 TaxID=3233899 RepID=UPI003D1E92E5
MKLNAPGIKNATAKVSKSSFSYSKTVKAASYVLEKKLVPLSLSKNAFSDSISSKTSLKELSVIAMDKSENNEIIRVKPVNEE